MKIVYVIIIAFFTFQLQAESTIQPVESIQSAAIAHMQTLVTDQGAVVSSKQLDPRLRLTQCDQAIETFKAPGSKLQGNTIVGVRCSGINPWSIYVQVKITRELPVVVLEHSRPVGHVLASTDLIFMKHDVYSLNGGYFLDINEVIGKELKHNLTPSRVLNPRLLKKANIVQRGKRVGIVSASNGIQVRMQGEALMNGSKGQRIRVRNLKSKRIVEGVVKNASTVVISM